MAKQISVVIPTHNRSSQLSQVLDNLLKSEANDFSLIEIIIVDDGSAVSPKSMIRMKSASAPFILRYERQENLGPSRARNNGYRKASANIVLFIDDDILVPPTLIAQHVVAHIKYPASVITGPCPCIQPKKSVPSSRYIHWLESADLNLIPEAGFVETPAVISGNLSIEREMFIEENGLYDDNLSAVAEDFVVLAKLKRQSIPIYIGRELAASHLQPTNIEETCKREYKHAFGIGELAIKMPELASELAAIKRFLDVNGAPASTDSVVLYMKKQVKRLLAKDLLRRFMLRLVIAAERILPFDRWLFPLFKMAVGVHIFAGIRDGMKKFQS